MLIKLINAGIDAGTNQINATQNLTGNVKWK